MLCLAYSQLERLLRFPRTCRELSLSGTILTHDAQCELWSLLTVCTQLTALQADSCNLHDTTLVELQAQVGMRPLRLEQLAIGGNALSHRGMQSLASALGLSRGITALCLSEKPLQAASGSHLRSGGFRSAQLPARAGVKHNRVCTGAQTGGRAVLWTREMVQALKPLLSAAKRLQVCRSAMQHDISMPHYHPWRGCSNHMVSSVHGAWSGATQY